MEEQDNWLLTRISISKADYVYIYSKDGTSNGNFAIVESYFDKWTLEFKKWYLSMLKSKL